MPNVWTIQSNMNGGEASPLIEGRKDVQLYYNSLEKAENVLSLPQGGVTKREGTQTILQLNDIERIEPFSFNNEQNYLLGFAPLKVYVLADDELITTITSPYTAVQIREFDYKQSADTAIIFHEDVQTRLITREEGELWDINAAPYINQPQYNFSDDDSPIGVPETHAMIFTDASNGDTFKLSLNDLLTEEIVFSETDQPGVARAMADALQNLVNTGNSGISAEFTLEDGAKDYFAVTFAGESADDWDVLVVVPVVTKKTTFEVEVEKVGDDGVSPKEDSWSDTRGWPRCGTFFQGRLWLGGSKTRPTTLWGSRSSDFFNFKLGRGLDNEAIEKTLDTDQLNAIVGIVGNRSLQVFTTGQEFYVPDQIITPEKSDILPQTNVGAKAVAPVVVDGVTVFVQKTGKSLVQFVYNDQYKANQSTSISFAAEHLIKDPIHLCVLKGTSSRDAVYMYINNSDGTVTVFNSLASEEVAGFTQYLVAQDANETSLIKWSAILDDTLYHIVERRVNGATIRTIEKETPNAYLDSSVTYGADSGGISIAITNNPETPSPVYAATSGNDLTRSTNSVPHYIAETLGDNVTLAWAAPVWVLSNYATGYFQFADIGKVVKFLAIDGTETARATITSVGTNTYLQVLSGSLSQGTVIGGRWGFDTQPVIDGGDYTMTAASAHFEAADVGKTIDLIGPSDGLYYAKFTIMNWINTTMVGVNFTAGTFPFWSTVVTGGLWGVEDDTVSCPYTVLASGDIFTETSKGRMLSTYDENYIETARFSIAAYSNARTIGACLLSGTAPASVDAGFWGFGAPASVFAHLEGLYVSCIADNTYLGEFLVNQGAPVDVPSYYSNYRFGLLYRPLVLTQKVNFDTRGGPIAHRKKKITQAAISLFESNAVVVNGRTLPDKTVGVDVFGPLDDGRGKTLFTGTKKLRMLGWTNDAQIEITQNTPDPLTIRSIAMEVTV